MSKENTAKIIAIAGGAALIGYLMVNQGVAEKIKNALAGLSTGGGGFPNINFPQITMPGFNLQLPFELPKLPENTCSWLDLWNSMNNRDGGGTNPTIPDPNPTIVDVVYTMPSWAKGVLGVSAGIVGGYGGFQIARYSAPALRTLGNLAAKGLAGTGNFLGRIFGTTGTAIATRLAQLLGRGGQAGMVEIGALSTLGGLASVGSVFPTLLTLTGTDQPGLQEWYANREQMASGGTPASVAPSSILSSIMPNIIIPSYATQTTPLMAMPGISANALASIGWHQVRQPSARSGMATRLGISGTQWDIPGYRPGVRV